MSSAGAAPATAWPPPASAAARASPSSWSRFPKGCPPQAGRTFQLVSSRASARGGREVNGHSSGGRGGLRADGLGNHPGGGVVGLQRGGAGSERPAARQGHGHHRKEPAEVRREEPALRGREKERRVGK